MNETFLKFRMEFKGVKAIVLLLLFFSSVSADAQNQNKEINKYLRQLIEKQELTAQDITDWKITNQHISSISGVKHIYFRQMHNGIEVNGANASIHILPDGRILAKDNQFFKDLNIKISGPKTPILSAIKALEAVSKQLNFNITESISIIKKTEEDDQAAILSDGGISLSDIPVKLIFQKTKNGQIVLAWDLSIEEISQQNWWSLKVDASTGKIIDQVNWMVSCDYGENHNHSHNEKCNDDYFNNYLSNNAGSFNMMVGGYNVFPMPIETPNHGPRSLVNDPDNAVASPFGWHDTNGAAGAEFTITRGNNVHAYEDGDNSGYSPDGGAGLVFDFPLNLVYSSGDQSEDAIITNLFYWNNVIHDLTYLYGFDEASGNFQTNNYGNGGLGDDWVRAEAQDNSGSCNANFGTPPDGSLPRMQMYICGNRDGDIDNMVIVHEYAHGISNRLTGGGNNVSCLNNQEQMGEGWSDWYGIVMTMQVGDQSTDGRGVGTWLFGQGANGSGIREFPYSTDMTVNSHTYDRIKTAAVPHGVGSVWSAMLWEVTWALVDQYGFDTDFYNGTGGNNMAIALVTEGMKLQPCNPGFVDGRDAILAADVALYGGANQCLIWEAFAKRGLGFSAIQGSPFSRSDGTEAFDIPGATELSCPPDMNLDCGEIIPQGATNQNEFIAQGGSVFSNLCAGNPGTANISFEDSQTGDECSGLTLIRTYTISQGVDLDECVQTFTLSAPNPPTILSCPSDQTIACVEDVTLDTDAVDAVTDCGLGYIVYVTQPDIAGAANCPGTTYAYTYNVVDDCGKQSSCQQIYTIENTAPAIAIPAGETVSCYEDIVVSNDDATVTTSCGEDYDLKILPPALEGTHECPGTTYTYAYRVRDNCGREVIANRVYTIGNNAPPTIVAPPDMTVSCDFFANLNPDYAEVTTGCTLGYSTTVSGPTTTGSANCPGATYTYTYTVTDDCGRTASDTRKFTIVNDGPTFLNCPDVPLQLNCEDEGWEQVIQAWLASVQAESSCSAAIECNQQLQSKYTRFVYQQRNKNRKMVCYRCMWKNFCLRRNGYRRGYRSTSICKCTTR